MQRTRWKENITNNKEGRNMNYNFKDRDKLKNINMFIDKLKCKEMRCLILSVQLHPMAPFLRGSILIYLRNL